MTGMPETPPPIIQLLQKDRRYKLEAYSFVRDGLAYAQDVLRMGVEQPIEPEVPDEAKFEQQAESRVERHLTGRQLCEAIRLYALEQYGYMAKVVLDSWGVHTTSDFGEIVYNLINIDYMKQAKTDRREDFDDVYDFDEAFRQQFQISMPESGD